MEKPNPSVRTCVLRVNAKCCNACRNSAKRKLQNVSGVSAVECNEEDGLITVSGDVNPMRLLRKVHKWGENHKWGRNAELVSVQNQPFAHDSPNNSPNTSQSPILNNREQRKEEEKKMKKKTKRSQSLSFLLRCFGINIKPTKAKVQPFTSPAPIRDNPNWQFPVRPENGRAWQFPNAAPPPPVYPPPHAMRCGMPQLPYPHPYFGAAQPPMPPSAPRHGGAGMFRAAMPQSPPQFKSWQPLPPQTVNPSVHYPRY